MILTQERICTQCGSPFQTAPDTRFECCSKFCEEAREDARQEALALDRLIAIETYHARSSAR